MTKNEVLLKAFELGAHIDISFHNVDNEKEAIELSEGFPQLEFKIDSNQGTKWLGYDNEEGLSISIFYD